MIAARSLLVALAILTAGCQMQFQDRPGTTAIAARSVSPLIVGIRLLAANQHALALDAFNRSITEEGVSANALAGIGVAYHGLGQRKQALKFSQSAVDMDPNSAIARNNLGVLLYDEGQFGAALQEFQQAYRLSEDQNADIATNIGFAQFAIAQADPAGNAEDAAEFDVVRQGHGHYRLEPRSPELLAAEAELNL